MTNSVRWGILGAGSMAQRFARDLAHTSQGTLAAVASRNHDRAMRLISLPGIVKQGAHAVATYSDLVHDDDVDAVYIATPTNMHCEHALLAIAAGKAVLCEKPLTSSPEEVAAIADAASTAGVFCMEALWTRFLPTFRRLETQIEALGPLRQINANIGFPRIERAADPVTDPALGGGALHDLGVYPLALALILAGPLDFISAQVRRSEGKTNTIRDVSALLSGHEGNVLISIGVSHSTKLSNRLEIVGENGRITIDAPFIEARSMRHQKIEPMDHRSDDNISATLAALKGSGIWPVLQDARRLLQHPDGKWISGSYRGTGLQFQVDEVNRCINSGLTESPLFPLAISHNVQALIAQICQSKV